MILPIIQIFTNLEMEPPLFLMVLDLELQVDLILVHHHLRFGGSAGTRFVTFNPIDSRSVDTVRVYAIRGNDTNGGETPDIEGIEDLRIQYQITDQGVAVDNGNWIDMGIVISAVDQGSGSGVLENYDFSLTSEQKSSHVYFRLFQEDNSGSDYDHYGILSITFLSSANAEIPESTITLTNNPLEPNPAGIWMQQHL